MIINFVACGVSMKIAQSKAGGGGARVAGAGVQWPSFHGFDGLLLYHRSLSVSLPKPRPAAHANLCLLRFTLSSLLFVLFSLHYVVKLALSVCNARIWVNKSSYIMLNSTFYFIISGAIKTGWVSGGTWILMCLLCYIIIMLLTFFGAVRVQRTLVLNAIVCFCGLLTWKSQEVMNYTFLTKFGLWDVYDANLELASENYLPISFIRNIRVRRFHYLLDTEY